jgi:putative alpha-1,2-mannosidase
MKRLKHMTLKYLQIALLALLPTLGFAAADSYRVAWRSDPATSMVIAWNQVSGSEPEVCYDTQDHDRKVIDYRFRQAPDRVEDYRGMNNCFVRLENLQPDTAYYFVICDSEGVGRRLWFRTAPAVAKPFTFIAGGDSRTNPEPRKKGNQLVAKLRPLFVLFGGDYTGSGAPAQWAEWFADWQLTISEDGRIYPIIATHGNHENADLQMMDKLFDTPHIDQYYSFGFADELMRIWVLNTELEYKAPDLVAAQQAWIEADLPQYSDVKWKVASYHRPMRPHTTTKAEGHQRIAGWAQLFYDQGIDLVVESDTHMVKRTYPLRPSDEAGSYESFVRDDESGTVFIGEGSWGAPMKPSDDNKPWTMACESFYQFKWIQVHPDEMLIRTVKFEDVEKVEALSEANLFDEPKNMVFWEPETGKVLRLPFDTEHVSYHAPAKPKPSTLIELGQTWSWSLDGESWAEGPAPLGYGDAHVRTSIVTANDKPRCAFFKQEFSIDDPAELSQLFFDLLVDDGCIIKLNGHEVIRYNMAEGEITNESLATKGIVGGKETQVLPMAIELKWLKAGVNTIEARVHQNTRHSSDLAFDLSVRVKQTMPVRMNEAEADDTHPILNNVDPLIGTGDANLPKPAGIAAKWMKIKEAKGNLHPGACLPFGMVSACSYAANYPTGYGRNQSSAYGISHFQQSGTGHIQRYYNFLLVTPTSGATTKTKAVSEEIASPGYYACNFDDVRAEVTVSQHAAFHRYVFPKGEPWQLKVNIGHIFMGKGANKNATVTVGPNSAKGVVAFAGNLPLYFYAQIDSPKTQVTPWKNGKPLDEELMEIKNGEGDFGVTFSGELGDEAVCLKVGFSFRSVENAEENLNQEMPGWDFVSSRKHAQDTWEKYLSRIQVKGGTPAQQQVFYTALYHSLLKPIDLTGESPFWSDDTPLYLDIATMWDVYKTQMPLLLSIYPERGRGIVESLIALYDHFSTSNPKRNAFLLAPDLGPSFSQQGWALCHQVIAHAHAIGLPSIEWEKSWPIVMKAFGDKPPSGKNGIDDSYAASCLIPIAKEVGDTASAKKLAERSKRWKGFYDAQSAKLSGQSHYQGTGWNYSYMVWHDVDELIKLHGSEERLIEDLDILFGFSDGEPGREIGRFQGLNNQADIDVPYMYGFVGRHDRIADVVRTAMTYSFGQGTGGLSGNDDSGALSAWFVWNAIGIFPIVGQDIYFIGSPLFAETTITIGSKPFRISAPETSDANRYVIGAKLNGKPLQRGFLRYAEIAQGGELELTMAATPGTWPNQLPLNTKHVSDSTQPTMPLVPLPTVSIAMAKAGEAECILYPNRNSRTLWLTSTRWIWIL